MGECAVFAAINKRLHKATDIPTVGDNNHQLYVRDAAERGDCDDLSA
jgi:hypothetical protein